MSTSFNITNGFVEWYTRAGNGQDTVLHTITVEDNKSTFDVFYRGQNINTSITNKLIFSSAYNNHEEEELSLNRAYNVAKLCKSLIDTGLVSSDPGTVIEQLKDIVRVFIEKENLS